MRLWDWPQSRSTACLRTQSNGQARNWVPDPWSYDSQAHQPVNQTVQSYPLHVHKSCHGPSPLYQRVRVRNTNRSFYQSQTLILWTNLTIHTLSCSCFRVSVYSLGRMWLKQASPWPSFTYNPPFSMALLTSRFAARRWHPLIVLLYSSLSCQENIQDYRMINMYLILRKIPLESPGLIYLQKGFGVGL